jgi:hypothetical protein
MTPAKKAATAYFALAEISKAMMDEGRDHSAVALNQCVDSLSPDSLARFYDIMEAAVAKVKA